MESSSLKIGWFSKDNIFVSNDGRPLLADLGISHLNTTLTTMASGGACARESARWMAKELLMVNLEVAPTETNPDIIRRQLMSGRMVWSSICARCHSFMHRLTLWFTGIVDGRCALPGSQERPPGLDGNYQWSNSRRPTEHAVIQRRYWKRPPLPNMLGDGAIQPPDNGFNS